MRLLTIFTPTYNRAYLLSRLYESLCRQTSYKFEWIIVDDESIDNTEEVITSMIERNNIFPIIYLNQKHGGKHRAINRGVQVARGDYFFIVDSDDYLKENAVELIDKWTCDIEVNKNICGVAGVRVSKEGKSWGGTGSVYGGECVVASNIERRKKNLLGDKAEIYLTDILRKYPFPEFEGEYFITENICWNAIAADGYKLKWYNEPIYVCDYLEDGLTKNGANERIGHKKNINGYACYVRQSLKIRNLIDSITEFREYNRTCNELKMSVDERAKMLQMTRTNYLLWLIKMPALYVIRLLLVRK